MGLALSFQVVNTKGFVPIYVAGLAFAPWMVTWSTSSRVQDWLFSDCASARYGVNNIGLQTDWFLKSIDFSF